MSRVLGRIFVASLARRRLATALSLFAIALGVALGLAVQIIHGAALDEFGRGMRLLAGEADLQVAGPRDGFDDALYGRLAMRDEVADASPVVELEVRLPAHDRSLPIFGIDALRVARVHPALMPQVDEARRDGAALAALQSDALFLSPAAEAELGVSAGERLEVLAGTRVVSLRVAGAVPGAGQGRVLAVMDIAAAQQLFGRSGRITRIDLSLKPGIDVAAARDALAPGLPAGVEVLTPRASEALAAGLSRAYRVNLTMLAAIALVTGGFLVFSTQFLAVARRRQEFAFLRALGLERGALMRGLLVEGAVVGFAGGLLGIALGHGFAAVAFDVAGGDLGAGYFSGMTPALRFDLPASGTYLLLGVLAGLAGAWLPAREARRMLPARALKSGDEASMFRFHPRPRRAAACLAGAAVLCLLPPLGGVPVFGYLAVALILVGAVLVLPMLVRGVTRIASRPRRALWRLANARLAAAPGQGVVAGAGVVASVALAVAMAIMVASFRDSVDRWLTAVLPADLYVSASPQGTSGFLDPAALARIAALPGVSRTMPVRFDTVRLDDRHLPVSLIARPLDGGRLLPLVGLATPPPVGEKPAWVSEAMADLFALGAGDRLVLPLGGNPVAFRVAGVWRDYARQQGAVAIELADYRAATGDLVANDVGVFLAAGTSFDTVAAAVRDILGENAVRIASPGEIRARSLAIFDRTFLVTYAMEAVAVLIGLFGVSTSFAVLAIARRKEFGVLRHLGMTRGEVGRLITLEGVLTAAAGTALGLVAGTAVAFVLIEVVNRQSFHWSMDLHVPFGGLLVFAAIVIALAGLAARVSGYQAMRGSAVLAVREDW
ncbi:putative ABC transport system permease protein [Aromatoleum tolulyticum]|uniref:Putative ABC transport system permease protein n=1 Tax=Aromatoleum tolulyticum TaxID=34027 RepID=A0A1N7AVM2_9RHOO|nr:FtsX-like permease family protein [Aromatoleum tolulyticum]SIR43114.1 putative ABC transport system permease protein [Aromatoleum tolulyticum]